MRARTSRAAAWSKSSPARVSLQKKAICIARCSQIQLSAAAKLRLKSVRSPQSRFTTFTTGSGALGSTVNSRHNGLAHVRSSGTGAYSQADSAPTTTRESEAPRATKARLHDGDRTVHERIGRK